MVDLFIPKSKYTPEIKLSATGHLSITGLSLLEDSQQLYSEVLNWLDQLGEQKPANVVLDLKFDHLDTSSVRSVVDIIKKLNKLDGAPCKVVVNWHHEVTDEDMRDVGDAIRSASTTDFNLIATQIDDYE